MPPPSNQLPAFISLSIAFYLKILSVKSMFIMHLISKNRYNYLQAKTNRTAPSVSCTAKAVAGI